jgi:DNA-binding NarL/FixJ family response regulator
MRAGSRLSILVADDHLSFRRELVRILRRQPEFEVAGEASNGAEAVKRARELRPHGLNLLLMDIDMPVLDGIAATAEINSTDPELPVVMLTVSLLDTDVVGALRAGARGFLSKDLTPSALVRTLRDFQCNGSLPMSRQMAARMLGYFREQERLAQRSGRAAWCHAATLTQRELEVLALVARGARDREIATALQVSETTIKTHVQHVLRKLHARNRTEAVAQFRPWGADLASESDDVPLPGASPVFQPGRTTSLVALPGLAAAQFAESPNDPR